MIPSLSSCFSIILHIITGYNTLFTNTVLFAQTINTSEVEYCLGGAMLYSVINHGVESEYLSSYFESGTDSCYHSSGRRELGPLSKPSSVPDST